MSDRFHLVIDEQNRWRVFREADALGEFETWAEANDLRASLLAGKPQEDTAPAWTHVSGGY